MNIFTAVKYCCVLQVNSPRAKRSKPVFLRVLFLVPYYFCFISMTYPCTSNIAFWTYLQMMAPCTHQIPICFLLNTDLENFSDWCDDNDMKKNTSKSKAMFLATRYTANKIMEEPPNITIRGEQIEISETEKLLGVHIDNSLSWSSHIESTLKKCNSLLFLLNRIKQYLMV